MADENFWQVFNRADAAVHDDHFDARIACEALLNALAFIGNSLAELHTPEPDAEPAPEPAPAEE